MFGDVHVASEENSDYEGAAAKGLNVKTTRVPQVESIKEENFQTFNSSSCSYRQMPISFNPFFKFAQALVNKVKCLRIFFYLHDAPGKTPTNQINTLHFAPVFFIFLFLLR